MSDKQLAPGFRQVDAFDSDEHYERDENGEIVEEISYVTLDLGAVEPTLVPSSSTYRFIVRGYDVLLSYSPHKSYSSVGPRCAYPFSSALWNNLSGYTPVTTWN